MSKKHGPDIYVHVTNSKTETLMKFHGSLDHVAEPPVIRPAEARPSIGSLINDALEESYTRLHQGMVKAKKSRGVEFCILGEQDPTARTEIIASGPGAAKAVADAALGLLREQGRQRRQCSANVKMEM